jgi:outer membrane protein
MKRLLHCFVLSVGLALAAPGSFALTLEEAVRAALDNNPDIEAAEHRMRSARAMLGQAQSAYYPWVNASAQYGRSDNPPQAFMMTLNQRRLNMMDPAFNPNEPDDTENLRGTLMAQWRLFDSGRREADVRMARLGDEIAQRMAEAVRNQLVFEVTRSYYQALQAAAFVEVQQDSVKSIEESLRIARERYNAGSAMRTDVLNLETQLAQAQEDLIKAQNGHELALAALNTVIGSPAATARNLTPVASQGDPSAVMANASADIEQRPEWHAAQLMARIKEYAWRKANREYGPTISLFASSDWDSPVSSDFEQSYMVGAMAEINLFDGFRTRGARAAARAEWQTAQAEARKTCDQLALDLTRAQLNLREAQPRLDVTEKNLESAREALRITREQYEQGAADIALLLQAQVGVTAMRTRHIAAQYDYRIALADWRRAQGLALKDYDTGN